MKAIPIHQAKAHLSEYIATAKRGTPVYIGSFGNAEVVLTALPKKSVKPLWGSMKGNLRFSEETWDAASKAVEQDFEDSLNRD